jgi:hypothetical protein
MSNGTNDLQAPQSFSAKATATGLSTKTTLLLEEHEIAEILSQPTNIEIACDR